MNIENLREYCLAKPGTSESFPFDESVLVFKVMSKMFAAVNLHADKLVINLKCDPDHAIELRENHPDIEPGFHMNKKHWNSVHCEGSLYPEHIMELIDHSYDLVCKRLKVAERHALELESE